MQRRALIAEETWRYIRQYRPQVPKTELIAFLDSILELHPKTLQPQLDALTALHSPRAPFLQHVVDGVVYIVPKDPALLAEDAPTDAPKRRKGGGRG